MPRKIIDGPATVPLRRSKRTNARIKLVEEVSNSFEELKIDKVLNKTKSGQTTTKNAVSQNDKVGRKNNEVVEPASVTLRRSKRINCKLKSEDEEMSDSFQKLKIYNKKVLGKTKRDTVCSKNETHHELDTVDEESCACTDLTYEDNNMCDIGGTNYVGLINQAMTCYLNSLLQALYMTPEFRNALYSWKYKSSESNGESSNTALQLQKLFLKLQISNNSSIETNPLTESFGWDSTEAWVQRDVQEFCQELFEALENDMQNREQSDFISKLYEGKITNCVKCLNCSTVISKQDTFLTIPLPVRCSDSNEVYNNLEESLKAFLKCETLEGDNQYFCRVCNKKTDAHKKLKFKNFPYIFTIQLKRFEFDQNRNCRKKLNDRLSFPAFVKLDSFVESISTTEFPNLEEDAGVVCDDSCTADSSKNSTDDESNDQLEDEGIDMSNAMPSSSNFFNQEKPCGKYVYELYAILIHSGNARRGHYYAYIKDFKTNKWLCFNDTIVTPITNKDIEKTFGRNSKSAYRQNCANAYILMYRKIDPENNCLPMKTEDFPAHIKNLVKKMKNDDKEEIKGKVENNDNKSNEIRDVEKEENLGKPTGKKDIVVKEKKKIKENKKEENVRNPVKSKYITVKEEKKNNNGKENLRKPKKPKEEKMKDEKVLKKLKIVLKTPGNGAIFRPSSRKCIMPAGNPIPLRRSKYHLRSQIRNYYSFSSDDQYNTN